MVTRDPGQADVKVGRIYIAWFPNGKGYAGQTTLSLEKRKRLHYAAAFKSTCPFLLYKAMRRYGWDSILWQVLIDDVPEHQLDDYEIRLIRLFGFHGPNGYNLTDGGHGARGYVFTEEDKAKVRAGKRGSRYSPEARARLSASRQISQKSPEFREKQRVSHLGKRASPETRARASNSIKLWWAKRKENLGG